MDYQALAREYMTIMHKMRKRKSEQQINDSLRGEQFVLGFIAHTEGSVIPSDISAAMGISTARIAAALNNLESKGLITRRIDMSDRRKILVELTEAGREKVAAIGFRRHEQLQDVFVIGVQFDAVDPGGFHPARGKGVFFHQAADFGSRQGMGDQVVGEIGQPRGWAVRQAALQGEVRGNAGPGLMHRIGVHPGMIHEAGQAKHAVDR